MVRRLLSGTAVASVIARVNRCSARSNTCAGVSSTRHVDVEQVVAGGQDQASNQEAPERRRPGRAHPMTLGDMHRPATSGDRLQKVRVAATLSCARGGVLVCSVRVNWSTRNE